MADLVITATEVLSDEDGQRANGLAAETITAGMAVYYDVETTRWYKSTAASDAEAADVGGIALNGAGPRQTVRVQLEGTPTLGASATIVPGTIYGLSKNAGGLCPLSDWQVVHYRTVVGCGGPNNTLALGILASGIKPGPILTNSLLKWCFAGRVVDNTAQVSPIIDRLNYEEVTLYLATGTLVDIDATFTVLLEHGDAANLSDAAAVDDADMISQASPTAPETAASFTFADDDEVRKLGYDGTKRYIRLTVTPALNAGNADILGYCVLGYGPSTPITQTPS